MLITKDKLHRQALEQIRPYVPGKPIEEVERELGLNLIVKLASNENPLGPSPRAMSAILDRDRIRKIHLYPDAAGYNLRNRLSEKLEVPPDQITLGNGSVEIVEHITAAFLDPGDEVIVGWPAFFKYIIATQIMDGTVVKVPLNGMKYDLMALARAVTPRTRLIFIANPNNPTGTFVNTGETRKFLNSIPDEIIVVFDEAYFEYITDEDYPDSIRLTHEGRNIITLRTFSKIYGLAGLRIGYGISRPDTIQSLNRVRETFNTSSLAQTAALHALDDTEHVDKSRDHNRRERARFIRELEGLGLRCTPSAANFVLVDTGRNAAELFKQLLEEGVIVRPMTMYELPRSMRITVGKTDENERVLEALSKIL